MLNVILFSILFMYIIIEGLSVTVSCLIIISDTEYDPSGNSNSSFHIGDDIGSVKLSDPGHFKVSR